MITFGDFRKSGHILLPPGYCEEWWLLEAHRKGVSKEPETLEEMIQLAEKEIPLHPKYIFYWKNISKLPIRQFTAKFYSTMKLLATL